MLKCSFVQKAISELFKKVLFLQFVAYIWLGISHSELKFLQHIGNNDSLPHVKFYGNPRCKVKLGVKPQKLAQNHYF